jgi:hypothetical protein
MAASTAEPDGLEHLDAAFGRRGMGTCDMPFAALVAGRPVSTCASLRERHRA